MQTVREYGSGEKTVVLVHGGPGAPGYMASLARDLEDEFHVFEPFQRGCGAEHLTVELHVNDLQQVIESRSEKTKPVVVGHSWGAMLALAHAAAYPDSLSALVLIGCGTFDADSRRQLELTRQERMQQDWAKQTKQVISQYSNGDERMQAMGRLCKRLDSCDLVEKDDGEMPCDSLAHAESWSDMLRLQADGVYPQQFKEVSVSAIMLHGQADPHPGEMIYQNLKTFIPHLEYQEFNQCGHYPWLERAAKVEFLSTLKHWLNQNL